MVFFGVYQNDYDSILVILGTSIMLSCMVAMPKSWFNTLLLSVLAGALVLGVFAPNYIVKRLSVYTKSMFGTISYTEKIGVGYQAMQNVKTVQAGGLIGDGYGKNTQKLSLPEATTDSIFAVLAAEYGFIGVVAILMLFCILIFSGFHIAQTSKNSFARLVATGLMTLIAANLITNMVVAIGGPVTGTPLLFFSKGGSNLIVSLLSLGIVLSVHAHTNRKTEHIVKLKQKAV